MELFINNAILHIGNNESGETYLSNVELDIDSDICYEFIQKHVKKLLNNPAAREAVFNAESAVYGVVQAFKEGELYFKDASAQICERLLDMMKRNADIPPADVIVVQFETRAKRGKRQKGETLLDNEYLAILKLNYREFFTHQTGDSENGRDNQIVKVRTALPFNGGKVEEACLIPYDPMILKILEKPYIVDGEVTNYFSELFLDCTPELSKKEVVQVLQEVSDEITEKHFNGDLETAAKVKVAVIDEAIEQDGTVSVFNIANRVFTDNEEARGEFVEMAKDLGVKPDVELGEKFARQHFGTHKFKASNGVEIKFPVELSDDLNAMEFTKNDDGSISITLKGLWQA